MQQGGGTVGGTVTIGSGAGVVGKGQEIKGRNEGDSGTGQA